MNWRNESEYPYDATSERWAWEFLRRSPSYREAYERVRGRRDDYGEIDIDDPSVQEVMEQFGIGAVKDPSRPGEIVFLPAPHDLTLPLLWDGEFKPQAEEHESVVCMRFDLRYSIETQLKVLKEDLLNQRRMKGIAEKRDRIDESTLRRYLRILDASDDGASLDQIAHSLLTIVNDSNKKTLSTDRTRAEEMRNGRYRELLKPSFQR